jgi:hypothetical protein
MRHHVYLAGGPLHEDPSVRSAFFDMFEFAVSAPLFNRWFELSVVEFFKQLRETHLLIPGAAN